MAVALFRRDIRDADWGNIMIASGWLSPEVYNQVAGNLEATLETHPQLNVKIIVGPEILLDASEVNKAWEIAQSRRWRERFVIHALPKREYRHFRMAGGRLLLEERDHAWDARRRWVDDYPPGDDYSKWNKYFSELWKIKTVEPTLLTREAYTQLISTL